MAAVSVALGLLAIGVPLSWGVPLAKRESLSAIKDGDKPGPPPIGEDLRRAISETPSLAYLQVDELFKDPKEAVRRAQQQVSEDMRTSMGPEKICNLNTFLHLARESAAKLTVVHEASLAFAAFNESLTSTLQKHPLEHCPSAPALSPQCPDPVMHVIVPAYRESLKDQSGAWGCHVNWKALAEVLTCQHVDVSSPAAYAEWARLVEKVSHVTCYRSNALAPLMGLAEPPLPEEHNTPEVRSAIASAHKQMRQIQREFQASIDAVFERIKNMNSTHAHVNPVEDLEFNHLVEMLKDTKSHMRLNATAAMPHDQQAAGAKLASVAPGETNLIASQADTPLCAGIAEVKGVYKPAHCQEGPIMNFWTGLPLSDAQCGGDCSSLLCKEECDPEIWRKKPECSPYSLSAPLWMLNYMAIMPFKVDMQCAAWSDAHTWELGEETRDMDHPAGYDDAYGPWPSSQGAGTGAEADVGDDDPIDGVLSGNDEGGDEHGKQKRGNGELSNAFPRKKRSLEKHHKAAFLETAQSFLETGAEAGANAGAGKKKAQKVGPAGKPIASKPVRDKVVEFRTVGKGVHQTKEFWLKQPPVWMDWMHLNVDTKLRIKYKGACRALQKHVAHFIDTMITHAEAQVLLCYYFNGNKQCQSSMTAANYLARETSPFAGLGSLNPWAFDDNEMCTTPARIGI